MNDITKIYYRLPKYMKEHQFSIPQFKTPYYKITYDGNSFVDTPNGVVNPPPKNKDTLILFEDTSMTTPDEYVGVNIGVYIEGESSSLPSTVDDVPRWFHMVPYDYNKFYFRINESLGHYLKYGKKYHLYFYLSYVEGFKEFPGNINKTFDLYFYKNNDVDSYYGNDIDNLYEVFSREVL